MALVKFRLHHIKNGTAIIRLTFRCEDGRDYIESMKERVKVSHFKENGRLIPSAKNAGSINQYLDDQQQRIESAIRAIRSRGDSVTRESLRAELKGQRLPFWGLYDSFLKKPPVSIGKSTLRMYQLMYDNLRALEKKQRTVFDFRSFDQTMADRITSYMREQGYADSTIATGIGKLRRILLYAKESKAVKEVNRFKTSAKAIDPGTIYLTTDEIMRIYEVAKRGEFSYREDKRKMMRDVAFYFVLGTQLGLRSVDLSISKGNLVKNEKGVFLNMKNQKTTSAVLIPVSALALEILQRYDWSLPKLSYETARRHLPEIAKMAEIAEEVIYRSVVDGRIVETTYKKYELVSPHTMRRSWATNLIKSGANPMDVMRVGGWKNWDSFQRYLRMSAQDSAEGLAKFL